MQTNLKKAVTLAGKSGYKFEESKLNPIELVLLDPLFFQCLGKSLGWGEGGICVEVPVWDYRGYWHRFIDHIADKKPIDLFFEELIQKK